MNTDIISSIDFEKIEKGMSPRRLELLKSNVKALEDMRKTKEMLDFSMRQAEDIIKHCLSEINDEQLSGKLAEAMVQQSMVEKQRKNLERVQKIEGKGN